MLASVLNLSLGIIVRNERLAREEDGRRRREEREEASVPAGACAKLHIYSSDKTAWWNKYDRQQKHQLDLYRRRRGQQEAVTTSNLSPKPSPEAW